ncbi:MAG: hypothetical protein M3O31_01340, partial [Acidobacteriota bacterium]|nr:hypothetical protein [Acidobacteriota bacterium]
MLSSRLPLYKSFGLLVGLLFPALLSGQVTTINVNNASVVQSSVKRFGINLGNQDFYDSGQ